MMGGEKNTYSEFGIKNADDIFNPKIKTKVRERARTQGGGVLFGSWSNPRF